MSDMIKIAVDAMGGDGSPKKIIDGIILNHSMDKSNFFKIFGDKNKIDPLITGKILFLSPNILKKIFLFFEWFKMIPSIIFFGEPSPPIASTAILIISDILDNIYYSFDK